MANPKKKSGKAKPGKGPGKKPNPQVGAPPLHPLQLRPTMAGSEPRVGAAKFHQH